MHDNLNNFAWHNKACYGKLDGKNEWLSNITDKNNFFFFFFYIDGWLYQMDAWSVLKIMKKKFLKGFWNIVILVSGSIIKYCAIIEAIQPIILFIFW